MLAQTGASALSRFVPANEGMSPWPFLYFLLLAACPPSEANPQDCRATAFIGITYRDRAGSEISIKSEIGVFAEGYAVPASGELYRVYDGFGDLGCSTPWQNVSYQRVALVRRGGCSVETKIENAIKENASAIVIYNNRDSLRLSRMKITSKYRGLISVVFTYKWKGDELIMLMDAGVPVLLDLTIANPCVVDNFERDRNMQLVSISFLCFIVLTISLAWLVFYHVQRYRDIQARERKAGGYTEADEKALKAIPTKTIRANDKLILDESECCAICIDPYKVADIVRTLVCNHEFHKMCIDPWLLENRTCPMCKKDILRHYGSVFTGSQESIIQVLADEASRLAGPSSPASLEIQVVIVGNSLDNVEFSNPPSPIPCNSKEFLTQRVQPCNTDLGNIATSSTSLMTLDSAHEALDLVQQSKKDEEIKIDSCEEINENVESAIESMEFSENRCDAEENDDNDETSSVKRLVPDKDDFTDQNLEEAPMAAAAEVDS